MNEMPNWFKRYEKEYNNWKEDNYPGIKDKTRQLLSHLLVDPETLQIEAILRTIYCYEILKLKNPLLKIATGEGKTLIMLLAYHLYEVK